MLNAHGEPTVFRGASVGDVGECGCFTAKFLILWRSAPTPSGSLRDKFGLTRQTALCKDAISKW